MKDHGDVASTTCRVLLAVGALGFQALFANASCAFRFAGYLDISEPPTWTVPISNTSSSEYRVLNENNEIVYLDEASEETQSVNCTGSSSWQYILTSGEYATELTKPDNFIVEGTTGVAFEDLFNAFSSNLLISSIPDEKAVAVSDSLFGLTVEVFITCNVADTVVAEEDSCIQFEVNFTNTSPLPDMIDLLYRFDDPAVPAVVLPASGNFSPGDIQLNEDNPIVLLDGSSIVYGCNGDKAEYLGEDGEWYFYFTGSSGEMYNLTHIFYATEQDHLNIATIQRNWSPNLEAALFNRTLRMLIYCNNIEERQYGYVYFRVGDGDSSFDGTCLDYPCVCRTVDDGCPTLTSGASATLFPTGSGGGRWLLTSLYALFTIGAASAFAGNKWSLHL